jgi:DNA-binding IclR family transcriptional regulator
MRSAPSSRKYAVPALEKGLEVLELLSEEPGGLTLTQIARKLGRSSDQLFRPLVCLEQRGYLHRVRPGDTYHLTPKLFVLSHRHPPTRRLLEAAVPCMQALSRRCHQSCHLSIAREEDLLVVAQSDAPDNLGFAVRTGTLLEKTATSSGLTWLAFQPETEVGDGLESELRRIRRRGVLKRPSPTVRGLTDLSAPILNHEGRALAVLSVPYIRFLNEPVPVDEVLEALRDTAQQLSETQGARVSAVQ